MTRTEPAVAVTLLGGVAVRRAGTSVRMTSTRAIAMLAYLVVRAPARQSRQHLAAVFWPDSSEPQARTNVRRELHQLRRLVPPGCLEVTDTHIGWVDQDSCAVDVRTFLANVARTRAAMRNGAAVGSGARSGLAQLGRQTVEMYAGPLLPGEYDDWAIEAREGLQRTCIALCDELVMALAESDVRTAIELARRRIQLDPLEEVGYRQLMRLQVATNDRSGALTTYHRCASLLEEQLGVPPTAETAELLTSIIELDSGAEALAPRDPVDVRSHAPDIELVGRDEDLAAVLAHWHNVRNGHPDLLLLTGDPGVGKSRLLTEVVRQAAADGWAVASSRCFSTSGVALSPVADWLRSPEVAAVRPSLDPVWESEVERLVPTGGGGDRDGTDVLDRSGQALADTWQRHRFYEGLCQALLSVDRPLLLTLDDLHWCDQQTLAWIAFLLRLAADRPVFVLATARADELRHSELRRTVTDFSSAGLLTEHSVEPLTLEATTALAARMFGRPLEPSDAALLQAASGGYPLYVVEAARASAAVGGDAEVSESGLGVVLRRRLAELSSDAQRTVALAGAIGRDFRLDLLVQASDQDEVTVARAVDELWRRRVLHQVGRGYDFSHDLLRDEAYALVDPAQRWLEHRRVANALTVLNADDLDAVAAQLAEQHERGGRPEEAVPFYFRAAVEAARVYANAEAVRLFRRCLDIVAELPTSPERDQRELDVRQAMSAPLNALYGYAHHDLRHTFERGVALAESLGRVDRQLSSLVGLWATTFVKGDIDGSHHIATRAIALADRVPALANQAHFSMGGTAVSLGRPELAVEQLDLACDLSEGGISLSVGSRPEIHARAWSAHGYWLMGDDVRADSACRQAVSDARLLSHPYSLAIALSYASITAQLRGDMTLLDDSLAELTDLCERHSYAYYREWALILSGWRAGGDRGLAQAKLGIAHLSSSGALTRMPYWLSLLADSQRGIGADADADASLDAAWTAASQRGDRWWLPEVLRARAKTKPPDTAAKMLRRAEKTAQAQSSPVLAQRCRDDLSALEGVSRQPSRVEPGVRARSIADER